MHQINLCPGGRGGLCWTTKLHPIGGKISGGNGRTWWCEEKLQRWCLFIGTIYIYLYNLKDMKIYIYILYRHANIYIYIYTLQALQKQQVPNNERSWTLFFVKRGLAGCLLQPEQTELGSHHKITPGFLWMFPKMGKHPKKDGFVHGKPY